MTPAAFLPSLPLPLRSTTSSARGPLRRPRPSFSCKGGGSGADEPADDTSSQSPPPRDDSTRPSRRSRGHLDGSKRALEMNWRFQQRKGDGPAVCAACRGRGRVECSWCHATGVLMLGDRLICSIEGQSHCLACDNGELECKACKGTGWLAPWMVLDM